MKEKAGMLLLVTFLVFLLPFVFARLASHAGVDSAQDLMKSYKNAECAFRQGEFEKALSEFRRIGSSARELQLQGIELESLRFEGLALWNLGRVSDSNSIFQKTLKMLENNTELEIKNFSRAAIKIVALYQKAKEDRGELRFAQALDKYRQAILLADQVGCDHLKLKCLRQMSLLLIDLGKDSEFKELMNTIIHIAEDTRNRRELCYSLCNYGLFLVISNDYIKALTCFQKAYEIALKYCESSIQADCLNNIGVCYQYLGDYDRAASSLHKAIPLITHQGNSPQIVDCLINLGAAVARSAERMSMEKDFSAADRYLQQGLTLANGQELALSEVNALINLGFLNELKGNNARALKYYAEAFRKKLKNPAFEQKAMILCNLGNVKRKLGEIRSALGYYAGAEKIAAPHSFNHILWEIYLGQGLCFRESGNIHKSLSRLKKSIEIIESIKEINGRNTEIVLSLDDRRQAYSELIETILQKQNKSFWNMDIEQIFDYIERAKSGRPSDYVWVGEKSERRKYYNGINIKGEVTLSRIGAMTRTKNALIDDKTAIVEYCLGRTGSFMICITKDGSEIYRIGGSKEIRKSIDGYLKAISTPRNEFVWHKAGERISLELLPNIEGLWNSKIKHIIIVPDNVLYLLPYEALCYKSKYLLERFSISYSPSSLTLVNILANNGKNRISKSYLGIGAEKTTKKRIESSNSLSQWPIDSALSYYDNYVDGYPKLPYCQEEIRSVYALFDKRTADVLLGADATETNTKKKAIDNYKVVHFACHGIIGVDNPLNSALVLVEDPLGKDDGYLQAKEILNMRIGADLVLLSSCESGLEAASIGYGVMGISKAFIKSGAKSVIATLWKINDRTTAYLIRQFFEKLLAGYTKNEALRYAKLSMARSKYSHPYYWAGFVLNGEYNSCSF